jgi:hypothetical protein
MAALHSLLAGHINEINGACAAQGQQAFLHVPSACSHPKEQHQATSETSVHSMQNSLHSTGRAKQWALTGSMKEPMQAC